MSTTSRRVQLAVCPLRTLLSAALLLLSVLASGTRLHAEQPLADPSLEGLTFLGGAEQDAATAIATDGHGNVFVVGPSVGPWGTPLRPLAGGGDAFVAKLDADRRLVWLTFLGSADYDTATSVALDAGGNVLVAGISRAEWGSPVRPFLGTQTNAFVAKLGPNGALQWNTFLGGNDDDGHGAQGLVVDTAGRITVVGYSEAGWGSPKRAFGGYSDAFVAQLDGHGALLWNTFLGEASFDEGAGLAVDAGGDVYVTGTSSSAWGAPVRPFNPASETDAFVAKLDLHGTLLWNTFLGGVAKDRGGAIAVDAAGSVFASGRSDGPWGAPKRFYTAGRDAFVAELDPNGALEWNTFLGGNGYDAALALAADGAGNVVVAGGSSDAWGDPAHAYSGGGDDAFVAEVDGSGALLWNTFYGSLGEDDATSVAYDGARVILAGSGTGSWGDPVQAFAGSWDAFVAALAVPRTFAHCAANATTLCLDDAPGDRRFSAVIDFHTSQGGGRSGQGHAVPLSSLGVTRGGLFWFFDPTNPELLLKVLNGCSLNGHYWVFYSAGTNVGLTLTVTDLATGAVFTRTNADLHAVSTVQNVTAFPCN